MLRLLLFVLLILPLSSFAQDTLVRFEKVENMETSMRELYCLMFYPKDVSVVVERGGIITAKQKVAFDGKQIDAIFVYSFRDFRPACGIYTTSAHNNR